MSIMLLCGYALFHVALVGVVNWFVATMLQIALHVCCLNLTTRPAAPQGNIRGGWKEIVTAHVQTLIGPNLVKLKAAKFCSTIVGENKQH